MPDNPHERATEAIYAATGAKPFCFMIMPFGSRASIYQSHVQPVVEAAGLRCLRADDVLRPGQELLTKVECLLEQAALVVADISDPRPNVFYEVGYAKATDRAKLILIRDASAPATPTDLRGSVVIEYKDTIQGMEVFERDLRDQIRSLRSSQLGLLHDMLEADAPRPAYIVASPRYPDKASADVVVKATNERTYGDNVGIVGLIAAFGSLWVEGSYFELISAQHSPDDLLERELNLYLVGGPRANPLTAVMLGRMQRGRAPNWEIGPDEGVTPTPDGDFRRVLSRLVDGQRQPVTSTYRVLGPSNVRLYTEDYGILLRGPHPLHSKRLVLVVAGSHALGTGAACLAATRSLIIEKLRDRLHGIGVDLADKSRTFWALVKGKGDPNNGMLDIEGVSIEEVGTYD